MAVRLGGSRRKTRNKFRKNIRDKGKINVSRYMQKFNIGDKAVFVLDSSCNKGLPNTKLHGRVGVIVGESGKNYIIELKDKNAKKKLNVSPVHLRRI